MVEPQGMGSEHLYALARDTLVVRGPDRKAWLDGLLTCAVADVGVGAAGYGLLLTKQGKIVTDVFLTDTGAVLFLGVAPGRGVFVRQLLDRYLVMEDAELEASADYVCWRLATSLAKPPAALAHGVLALGTLRVGVAVVAESDSGLVDAADLLAEHGLGVFGVDFGERDNPHEASLDRLAVSWTKGCYLGQEVVCMQDMRGKVKRRLVALDGGAALLSRLGPPLPEVLAADGGVAGQVMSSHERPGGVRLLASISTSALDAQADLTIDGERVRLAFGTASKLS